MPAGKTNLVLKRSTQVLLGIVVFVAAWHLTVRGFGIPKYLVPVPLDVLYSIQTKWPVIVSQTWFTLSAAAFGLMLSTLLAVTIAIAFTMSRNLAQASLPVVLAFRSTPVAAVAPIMMLIFGRGISTSTLPRGSCRTISSRPGGGIRPALWRR